MDSKPLLELKSVSKRYESLLAVDDVSLEIHPGEIFALLGPNGAGKTTLIGCVGGLTVGFDGEIRVAGYDAIDDYRVTRRLIGLVPQELNYDAFFSVRESLDYQSGYFGVSSADRKTDELLEQFSLSEKADEHSRWLSGGMKRRLMICKALVHDPVLLFLDEPTAGVDVELRDELWEYVRKLRRQGMTIVLTTHYLEEAEALADRVGILNEGRLIRVQERDELLDEFGARWAEIELDREPESVFVDALPSQVEVKGRGIRLEWSPDDEGLLDQTLSSVYGAGLAVTNMEMGRTSLETIFKELVYSESES